MKGWLGKTWRWWDERLGMRTVLWPILRHPVPPGVNWWYVFGSATMALFTVQVLTGILLALVYVPSTAEAYHSLVFLNEQTTLGWLLRAIHYYGASGMIVLMAAHMIRVFVMGAFKHPRQLTWLVGVGLFVCTLGMGFTGQALRWDSDAYWGLGVAAGIAGRIPVFGDAAVRLLLGGPTIGPASLSRFFVLHVFVLVGLLGGLLALHLYLVVRLGISAPPVAGQPVDPRTYRDEYQRQLDAGEPFFPDAVMRDAVVAGLVLVGLVAVSAALGPRGPGAPADPAAIGSEPRPDWYFLPLFSLLAISPRYLEDFLMLGLPPLVIGVLLAVPLVSGKGERSPRRRPVAVLSVLVLLLAVGSLEWLAYTAPWSPKMSAWSGDAVPPGIVRRLDPIGLQGAAVFQFKTCRNCHALEGKGGHRGPDLTYVATRLTRESLVRQVIQGGGNMPAYGSQLKPDEVEALVEFLGALRPPNTPAARSPAPGEP